jgi:hypothetical protein
MIEVKQEKEAAMRSLAPEHPHDAGLRERIPDRSHIEGAELLANQARSTLRSRGFTDDEVDEWALTYISAEGSGDEDAFLEWIREQERRSD